LIAGYLLKVYGPKNIFFIGSLLVLTSFILMKMFRIKDNRKSKKIETNIFKIVKEFFSNKNRTLSYIISTSVTIWWALIFIYLPIHIVEGGYNELLVGIFLSAVIIPLILLEYKFGKIGGKKGFKKLFFSGFIILGLISIACFFVSNIYLLLGLLILASVGIAMIEPTSEAYFFDLIGENQRDKYYGVYNTGVDIGYFIGTLPASLILIFLPFKFIFPFFALFMIVLAIVSLKIKEVYEYKRK
jgi:MFS family permease